MGSLTVIIIWLGLFPSPVLKVSEKPVQQIIGMVNKTVSFETVQEQTEIGNSSAVNHKNRKPDKKTVNSKK
jgi:hypothetical protein